MKKNCQNYFCSNPFDNAIIDEHGDVFLCCQSWLSMPVGNLLESSWEEIWNGPVARSIRQTIHDGSYVYCSAVNCPYLQGQPGRFKPRDEVSDPYFRTVLEEQETILARGPSTVTISYDPTCNLACPSCRCGYIVAKGESFERAKIIHDKVWASALDDCTCLYITGMGDPISSRLYRQILREFDATRFPNMKIALITNGLLLTPGMWESLRASHGAINSINVSINACSAESFAINQQGGSWESLLENLTFMKTLRERGAIDFLGFGFFVHENNFHEMADFMRLGKRYGVDMVTFANMQNWGTYSPEEFARIAVHLEEHPRHQALREMLQDPIFKDPICRMGNLSSLLPDAQPPGQVTRHESQGPVHLDEFCRWIMVDEAGKAEVATLINGLKSEVADTLAEAPSSGEDSPVALLARMQWAGEQEDMGARMEAYMRQARHPQADRPYIHVIQEINHRGRAALEAMLEPHQAAALALILDRPLHDIDTGADPLGQRVYGLIEALKADAPNGVAPGNGAKAAASSVAPGVAVLEAPQVRQTLRDFRDDIAALYGRTTQSGRPAPLEILADGLRRRQKNAQKAFVDYAGRERDPESGASYLQAAQGMERQARERMKAALRPEEWDALRHLLPDSLLSLDIGYDPFSAALRARIEKCPL